MGFLLNDALVLIKSSENIKLRNSIFTVGYPTSHVSFKNLIFLLNDEKYKIKKDLLNQTYLKKIYRVKKNKKLNFRFFAKLLNFDNFYNIDNNPKKKPTYCIDITKNNSKKFRNKADLIYDTGSLGYTKNPLAALFFLSKLLKKPLKNEKKFGGGGGVIVHQLPHNGFIKTGYFQFNLSFLIFYYNKKKFRILKYYYGFFNNFFKRLFFRKKFMINIEKNISTERLKKSRSLIYFIAQKM